MSAFNLGQLAEETAAQRALSAPAVAPQSSAAATASFPFPPAGDALFEALGGVLHTLRSGPGPGEDWRADEVEVEVRIGAIAKGSRRLHARADRDAAQLLRGEDARSQGTRFVAGVDESFARQLRARLASRDFVSSSQSVETVLGRAAPGDDTRLVLLSEDAAQGETVVRAERKSRVLDLQVALLAFDYDARVCAAVERDLGPRSLSRAERAQWDRVRVKRRTSYSLRRGPRLWRVDFTEVSSSVSVSDGKGEKEREGERESVDYEVEVELEPAARAEWVAERDVARMRALTVELAATLLALLQRLVPRAHTLLDAQMLRMTELPPGGAAHTALRRALVELNQTLRVSGVRAEFLGSMPINLFRKALQGVQRARYLLTEKTDGVRYLLYTLRDEERGGAALQTVLLNRDCALFTLRGGERLAAALGEGCVLDGEVVFSLSLQRHVFLVFDALVVHGVEIASLPFSQRLQRLQELLRDDVVDEFNATLKEGEIALRVKQYFDKGDVSTLVGRFFEDPRDGERYFLDERGKPSHSTDGIIFQPDTPYVFGRCSELFKWKWADMRSVDLGVAIILSPAERIADCDTRHDAKIADPQGVPASAVHLWCGTKNGDRVDCTRRVDANVSLGTFDTLRMLAEYDDRRKRADRTRPIIAEVCYDTHVGVWTFLQVRHDKAAPNAIEAVMGVFTEQAEAICIDELEFSLLESAMNGSQSFSDLLQTCKAEIVRLQRNKRDDTL